jgi:hypothetical protein
VFGAMNTVLLAEEASGGLWGLFVGYVEQTALVGLGGKQPFSIDALQ